MLYYTTCITTSFLFLVSGDLYCKITPWKQGSWGRRLTMQMTNYGISSCCQTPYIKKSSSRFFRVRRFSLIVLENWTEAKKVSPAFLRSSSHVADFPLNTMRRARSWILSSFLRSYFAQKYHTIWQYVKLGKIAYLYKWSLVSVEIISSKRDRTPIFLLVFIQISCKCDLNLTI